MKRWMLFVSSLAIFACQETEQVSDFTGNEATYSLQQGSQYAVSGTITFREKTDGTTAAEVKLSGTDGNLAYPVHLHLGNIATANAPVALLLSPVKAETGKSETIISKLADETVLSYKQIIDLEACIKIHLADSGPDRNIILAGGNIGKSSLTDSSNGRIGFGVCKSE